MKFLEQVHLDLIQNNEFYLGAYPYIFLNIHWIILIKLLKLFDYVFHFLCQSIGATMFMVDYQIS